MSDLEVAKICVIWVLSGTFVCCRRGGMLQKCENASKSLFMCSCSSMGKKKRFMKKSGDEEVVVVLVQQITITHN
jgi:hypothetical protein